MHAFTRQPSRSAADPIVRVVFSEIVRELGVDIVPNVFHAMASMPDVLDATWCLTRATLLHGRLPRALKEMAGLVVSIVNASPYSRSLCLQSLTRQGVDLDVLAQVASGELRAAGLSRHDAAVLELARVVALREGRLRGDDYAAAAHAGVSREEALEVAAVVQLFTSLDRFAEVAGAPVDLW